MMIGKLRHKIQIQSPSRRDEEGGGAEITWQTEAEAWARIEPLSGREEVSAEKRRGRLRHTVTLRWRPGLGPTQRLLHGRRVLDIESVADPDGRRRWLVCACTEHTEP